MSCPFKKINNQKEEKSSESCNKNDDLPCAQTENVVSIETTTTQTDFYQILGIDEDASYQDIKRKWLKLSLLYHPDKCEGNDDMFRKINLAYKVLSNPENRRKYNNSLAKTYDQLRDNNRDTNYQVNKDFLKIEDNNDGRVEFDREKFLDEFEGRRGQYKNLNDIEVVNEKDAMMMPKKSIEQIRAERDQELETYREEQKTEMFDPKRNNEEFNYIFKQFKHITRTDLEESDASGLFEQVEQENNLDFSSFNSQPIKVMKEIISELTSEYRENYGDDFNQTNIHVVTTEEKTTLSKLEELMAQRKKESDEISSKFRENAENTLSDNDKVILDKVNSEEIIDQSF
jgi:curved DNA-binding protein CbpA